MHTLYRGLMHAATQEPRADAVRAARSMGGNTKRGGRELHRSGVSMPDRRRGDLQRADRLTDPEFRRGRKPSLPS